VSDSSHLAYLRERTCELELDIGAFLHCKEFENLLRALGLRRTVLRKLGSMSKGKG